MTSIGVSVFNRKPAEKPAALSASPASPAGAADMNMLIGKLEQRLKEDPGSAEGWRLLGLSYSSVERYADAVRAYERATQLNPKDAELWSALGEARTLAGGKGMSPDALAAFRMALALDPREPRARFFMGLMKLEQKDAKGAVDDWIALLKDASADAPWAASVRQKVEEVAAANGIDIADRLAGIPPAGPTPQQVQAAQGMSPAEQEAMARQMVESLAARLRTNPRDPDGWVRLMRARMVLGGPDGAAQALRDAQAAYAGDSSQQAVFAEAARNLGVPGN